MMEIVMYIISFLAACLPPLLCYILIDYYYFSDYSFWKRRGVPTPGPVLPFFGNLYNYWKKNLFLEQRHLAKELGPVYGFYKAKNPWLLVSDPELMKQICIKNFDCFTNRESLPVPIKYVRRMLSDLQGEEWKKLRNFLTPLFTSGKLKGITPLIVSCAENCNIDLEDSLNVESKEAVLELKPIYSVFTTSVMASCGFGMTSKIGVDDPFIHHTRAMFVNPRQKSILSVIPTVFPRLAKYLPSIFPSNSLEFFIETGKQMTQMRKSERLTKGHENQRRNDFLDWMLDAQEKEPEFFDDEFLVGQIILFLLAGTDTTSSLLLMFSYELALHPYVQEKLFAEIQEKLAASEGLICYEMVHELFYLEQVLNEVQRLWPATGSVGRTCTKTITLNGIEIPKGTNIQLSMFTSQRSEDLWERPDQFLPERFADKSKERHIMSFMPFGHGPRNCIGMRFAQLVSKIAAVHLVSKFKFAVSEADTDVPPKMAVGITQIHSEGLKLLVRLRKS